MPEPSSSSTNRYRGQGYYQQPYWRNNPRTSMVEYAPGYHVPADRWMQRQDGSWNDLVPQTPDQSIFFHQPSAIRRQNEMYLLGYTFSMGL